MNKNTDSNSANEDFTELEDSYAAAADEALSESIPISKGGDDTIDHLTRELEESRKRELMAQAELENYRKRTQRDVEQTLKYACVPLVRDLVEVVDNLVRARDSASGNSAAQSVVDGVKMVHQQFLSLLEKFHCKPIAAVGQPFDPNIHQAIAQAASEEYAAGIITLEASIGYTMHDRVVRPSQVIVSTGPSNL